jgi:hypothetical protein
MWSHCVKPKSEKTNDVMKNEEFSQGVAPWTRSCNSLGSTLCHRLLDTDVPLRRK